MPLSYYYALEAPYVKMFSLGHILYLLTSVLIITLFIWGYKWVQRNTESLRKVFLGIILFQQVFLMYGWYLLVSPADALLRQALPLEMCRISSLLTIAFLFTRDSRFMDIVAYFGIYAIPPLIYPKNIYHLTHINGVSYMINHLMTILTPIFGAIAFGWRPTWRSFRRASIAFTVYLPAIILVNHLTGGNYFYLVDRPFFQSMSAWQFDLLAYGVTIGGFALFTWAVQAVLHRKGSAVAV